jgi:hypothetical protein
LNKLQNTFLNSAAFAFRRHIERTTVATAQKYLPRPIFDFLFFVFRI